jgi:hypothetical protein
MQMDKEIKELTRQRDLFQNLLQSVGKDQAIGVDQDWASQWSGVANDPSPVSDIICENLERTTSSSSISNEHLFKQSVNSEDNFLLDGSPPTFVGPDPCQGWEEMGKRSESEDNCSEVSSVEIKEVETEHKTYNNTSVPVFEESEGNSPMIQFVDVDDKSSSGNGHSDQDAPRHKTDDIKGTNNHLVDLSMKSNDSFESEPCCLAAVSPPQVYKVDEENSPHPQFGKLEQNAESSSGNGHSNQDTPHQKTEDIIRTNGHIVDLSMKFNDSFESGPRCWAPMSPSQLDKLEQNVKSSSGKEHSDQDAPHLKTEEIIRTNDHLVDLSKKSNESFDSDPCCLAAMSPPQVDKLVQNVKSSPENGHSDQDAPHKKTEDTIRTNDHRVDLSKKSNDSFESEHCCLAAISPPQVDKVDHENSPHPQFGKLEQNVSPPSFNNVDQEPTLPSQYDREELKTMSPPQLDYLEQVSFKSPASVEKEYSTSLVYFPEKLSEPKLRAKRRKPSRKSSQIHEMRASVEDAESVMDSDEEETSSVLNFVVRMNDRAKSKSADKDIDNRMVRTNENSDVIYLSCFITLFYFNY